MSICKQHFLDVSTMKIAVYLNGIAPYDEILFRGVTNFGIDIHLFSGGKIADRPFWSQGKSFSGSLFKKIFLDSMRLNLGKYVEYFDPRILSFFLRERYDIVLVPFGSLTGLLLLFVAKLLGSLTISWCGVHKFHFTLARILGEPIVRLYILLSSTFFAYSNYSKQYLIHEGANPKRILVLNPNGVDIQKLNPENDPGDLRDLLNISETSKIILFVGRLEKEKGVEYLLKSMKIVKEKGINAHLLIVGTGSQLASLKNLVRELKLEKIVTFTGSISNTDINKYYALCDIHVAPSIVTKYFVEPFGMVYQEAMASGKPSIAFDIPAPLREIIVDGKTGYLVPEKDVTSLANKICELSNNDNLRMLMGKNARVQAIERYDIGRVVEKWANTFKELINQST